MFDYKKGGDVAQLVGRVLSCNIESLEFNPKHCIKSDMMAHTCNASIQEVEEGGSEIQGHPRLHGELRPAWGT